MRVKSATVLLPDAQGRILAVSRGDTLQDWGMPGGFIEPGEGPVEAAARELREETNIAVAPEDLVEVYRQSGCITYTPTVRVPIPDLLYSDPFEGYVAWVDPEQIACASCTFRRENGRMLRALGLI